MNSCTEKNLGGKRIHFIANLISAIANQTIHAGWVAHCKFQYHLVFLIYVNENKKTPNITQQMSSATQSTVWLKTNKHTVGILHLWYLVGVPKKLAKTTNWLMRFGAEPAAANIQAVFAYFAFFSLSFTHAYALRWHQWQMLTLSVLLLQRAEWNNLSFSKK